MKKVKENIQQIYFNETGQTVDKDYYVTDENGVTMEHLVLWNDNYVRWLEEKYKNNLLIK